MAADDDVDTIVMDVNSPGGMVTELAETARLVADTTKAKTVVAVAAPYALSAAYWLASQAGRLVVAESGQVGSIGGYLIHEDISQMLENEGVNVTVIRSTPRKAEGMAVEPLTDEALEYFEGLVRRDHESFVHAVAIGRRVSVKIAGGEPFGAGRSVQGADAVSAGMADEVGDLESVVAGLVTGGGDRSGTRGGSRRRAHDRGRARLALAL
ncbi:MAG: S49 family peptidase [Pseudomonadota bacterium]